MLSKEQIDEIKMMYREAKNKKKQIGILAQLYVCTNDEIRDALGLQAPGPKKEEEKKLEKTEVSPTRCQLKKAVDVWEKEEIGETYGKTKMNKEQSPNNGTQSTKEGRKINNQHMGTITEACNAILKQFDENEKRASEIRQQVIPLVREYREIISKQMEFVSFIENMCDLAWRKA